jgi:O-antigen ligase
LVALAFALATPGLVKERFATLTASGNATVTTRVGIWKTALSMWEQHPILGVGLGNFPAAYANTPVPGKVFLPNTVFQPPPHAHDVFLQLMAEQGIFGLLTFVGILAVALRATVRLRAGPERWIRVLGCALLGALLVFLAQNLFDLTIEDPQTGLYMFTLFGLIAACELNWADGAERRSGVEVQGIAKGHDERGKDMYARAGVT